jgi:radical SAM superfamily enzyme YgiQ (UPF0313 family)
MSRMVLFVNGPSQDASDRFFGWPTSLLYAIAPTVKAIQDGELSLGYVPQIFDPISYIEGRNDEAVEREFKEQMDGVDIVCASATYDSLYPTIQLFAEAKTMNPKVLTVLGGPHVDEVHDLRPGREMGSRPGLVDFGIAGDGEYALKALLGAISDERLDSFDASQTPGRACIYGDTFRQATSGQPLNLDTLPFMPIQLADSARHANDFDVFADKRDILPTVQMISKRGCAYSCEFCSEQRGLAYPNARSIDNILEEIARRKAQGYKAVFFDDSTFGSYPRLGDLLCALGEMGLTYGCLNRFDHLTRPDLVEAYHNAGFKYVYCAIEQFSDGALMRMKKGESTLQMQQAMELLADSGFLVGVSLLYGLECETEESIAATLDFVERWVQDGTIKLVSESVLSYHPGTPGGRGKAGRFDQVPPNRGFPFDRFEEGQWYHPAHVTPNYLKAILMSSEKRFGDVMVRNRHSWYARNDRTFSALRDGVTV